VVERDICPEPVEAATEVEDDARGRVRAERVLVAAPPDRDRLALVSEFAAQPQRAVADPYLNGRKRVEKYSGVCHAFRAALICYQRSAKSARRADSSWSGRAASPSPALRRAEPERPGHSAASRCRNRLRRCR